MNDVAVFVPSHDGYADLWPIAADLYRRFWPDRPWPMYWVSNGKPVPDIATPLYRSAIHIPEEWGNHLADALESIPESLVLFWFEEILLMSPVPTDLCLEAADLIRTHDDIGIVQLNRYYVQLPAERATLGRFTDYPQDVFGFSASLPALFRKSVLMQLMRTLKTSRDFEMESTTTMRRDLPQYRSLIPCVPVFRFCDNALQSGKWRKCSMKHLADFGFSVEFSLRGMVPDDCRLMEGAEP